MCIIFYNFFINFYNFYKITTGNCAFYNENSVRSGSLYKDHPMVELMDEIINECLKQKKKKL